MPQDTPDPETLSRLEQTPMPWEPVAQDRAGRDILPRLPEGESLSVVFPAYNDAHTIGALVDWSAKILARVASDYEIIVVNDGSLDETAAVLASRQEKYPFLRVVSHEKNGGYGTALRSGFEAASKTYLFYTDGDGQYDPTELVLLLPQMIEGVGMVNGYKLKRGDSWVRVVVGRTYHWTAKLLFGLPVRDIDCDFRLMRLSVLRSLTLTSSSGSICTELVFEVKNSKMQIVEAPVHHYPRVSGASQFFKPTKILASLGKLLALWRKLILWRFGGRVLRALGLRK
ncbi:glycosyltransferase family 2 protein [Armatimonas sp.]|uniref:glycosyltransferase family 2 protein n=1 Tax=Armatimonas sp. TaxID=1872638 RepID=UPI003751477E